MNTPIKLSKLRGMDFTENLKDCEYKGVVFAIQDLKGIHTAWHNGNRISYCVCIEDFKKSVKHYIQNLKKE